MINALFKNKVLLGIFLLAASLRVPALDIYPPALYSDELSQGYNAYALLKTGKDEFGVYYPVVIRSFGDWKPALQTYILLPTISLFGLNAWGVRIPSALFGTFTIIPFYYLLRELLLVFKNLNSERILNLPYVGAFLLAIAPWHIFHSRIAMHGAITLFFFIFGVWSFLKGFRNLRYWYLSSISFTLLPYAYVGMHLVIGLVLLILGIYFFINIKKNKSVAIKAVCLFLLLQMPLIIGFVKNPDILSGRARYVSIFFDQEIPLKIWQDITTDGADFPTFLAQFFHNKPFYYVTAIVKHIGEHISGTYLFLIGDDAKPFQIPSMGILYLVDALTLSVGSIYLIKKNSRVFSFIFLILISTLLPASLTFLTPSAHRSFSSILVFLVLTAFGFAFFWKDTIGKVAIMGGYVSCFVFFLYSYFILLPLNYASWWDYGEKELMIYLKSQEQYFDSIYISENLNMPYIALLFYQQVNPSLAQELLKRDYLKDAVGFEHVQSFGKYNFIKDFSTLPVLSNNLYVVNFTEKIPVDAKVLHTVTNPDWSIAYQVFTRKKNPPMYEN